MSSKWIDIKWSTDDDSLFSEINSDPLLICHDGRKITAEMFEKILGPKFVKSDEIDSKNYFKPVGWVFGKYPVIYYPSLLYGMNTVFSSVVKNPLTSRKYYTIAVDNYWLQAPLYVKCFCVFHELGHIKHRDLSKELGESDRNIPFEQQADIFASKNIGKNYAVNSLNYIFSKCPYAKEEMVKRIDRVSQYV